MAERGVVTAVIVMLAACGSDKAPSSHGPDVTAGADSGGSTGDAGTGATNAGAPGDAGEAQGGANAAGTSAGGTTGQGGEGPVVPKLLCGSAQPFGERQPLTTLNTADHEAGPRLTPDELMIAHLRYNGTTTRVFGAVRSDRNTPFEASQVWLASDGGVPWLSDDGLFMLYEDDKRAATFGTQRESVDAEFQGGGVTPVADGYGDPYVVGGPDGRIYMSTQAGQLESSPLNDWFPISLEPVPGADPSEREVRPVVTPDQLTMYFGAEVGARLDIFIRERDSTSEPFGPALPVDELNTPDDEFPSWISPDGCRLYYDSGLSSRDLYVAERVH